MKHLRTLSLLFSIAIVASVPASVEAAGISGVARSAPARADNPDYTAGKGAADAGDYQRAIELMSKVVATEPKNADAMNYLGYSYRKLGDYEESLDWYQKALAEDPEHRGANEYLGELYLQVGDLGKAKAQLAKLDKLCFFGCEEYDDLKKAIAEYKTTRPPDH